MASVGPAWYHEGSVPMGTSYESFTNVHLRAHYEKYIVGATRPPQQQWDDHYVAAQAYFQFAGYSEKEIKWWMLRTGQGPECFRQMQIGVPCGLPPYEVWRDWYFRQQTELGQYQGNWGMTGVDGIWYPWPLIPLQPVYPPPGYSMPGMPCNTAGKKFPWSSTGSSDPNSLENKVLYWLMGYDLNPWPLTDLPPVNGDPFSLAWARGGLFMMGAPDAIGAGTGAAFCKDDVDGILHPVPTCYTVFIPQSVS